MKRLLVLLGVGTMLGVVCSAQSSPGVDTMLMPNLIEVNVGATKSVKKEAPRVETPSLPPSLSREEALARVETCEQQASALCNKMDNYRGMLQGSKKKDLMLKTTGYYKPTVLQGADEVRANARTLCKNVNDEIRNIQSASQISVEEQQRFISRLEKIKGLISSQTEKIASLMARKLKV